MRSIAFVNTKRHSAAREPLRTRNAGSRAGRISWCVDAIRGAGAFLNFNCVILDVVRVEIGEATQIGPAVQIYAADHPRDPAQRRSGLEFGRRVRIGRNVWIGGGAIILPGIVVGDDALIGAGSVVTRDVPAGATVRGNPAR